MCHVMLLTNEIVVFKERYLLLILQNITFLFLNKISNAVYSK